ncbi:hypothetical protein PGO_114580 [Plasmodium gonderi]|uniref:Uncharacterized protein n=1 Tax=Plasmodium gonderi TaxID=77519 RepID=A0A1Y1JPL4_PLAGO|nr:hypothetical protein PGO_114580 [Plasmodium gonderi]GAW82004.1 hypothetical protein PGO_114580 [Plasmodium gonderi]
MNMLNCLARISLFTLFIYNSYNFSMNENGLGKVLDARHIRSLSEMNANSMRADYTSNHQQNQYVSGDSLNEQRDASRESYTAQSGAWSNTYQQNGSESPMYERVYRNTEAPDYYNNNVRYLAQGDNFNKELFEKLKTNAVFIIPALLFGFYVLRNTGMQTLLMMGAIGGILMYTHHYVK